MALLGGMQGRAGNILAHTARKQTKANALHSTLSLTCLHMQWLSSSAALELPPSRLQVVVNSTNSSTALQSALVTSIYDGTLAVRLRSNGERLHESEDELCECAPALLGVASGSTHSEFAFSTLIIFGSTCSSTTNQRVSHLPSCRSGRHPGGRTLCLRGHRKPSLRPGTPQPLPLTFTCAGQHHPAGQR